MQEEFQTVVTAGMRVLVAALETRAAPSLKAMTQVALPGLYRRSLSLTVTVAPFLQGPCIAPDLAVHTP